MNSIDRGLWPEWLVNLVNNVPRDTWEEWGNFVHTWPNPHDGSTFLFIPPEEVAWAPIEANDDKGPPPDPPKEVT